MRSNPQHAISKQCNTRNPPKGHCATVTMLKDHKAIPNMLKHTVILKHAKSIQCDIKTCHIVHSAKINGLKAHNVTLKHVKNIQRITKKREKAIQCRTPTRQKQAVLY